MSSTTTNLHLVKPSGVDQVDIDVINSNMDLIDTAVKSAENPIAVAAGSNTYAAGVNQLTFNDAGTWKGLDEVRLYNGTDALYCKQGVTTGLLMQDNQIKVVPVTWNGNVPAVGTMKGYISADGNYHLYDSSTSADSTSLATLRDSVSNKNKPVCDYSNNKDIASTTDVILYEFTITEPGMYICLISGDWNISFSEMFGLTITQGMDVRGILRKNGINGADFGLVAHLGVSTVPETIKITIAQYCNSIAKARYRVFCYKLYSV